MIPKAHIKNSLLLTLILAGMALFTICTAYGFSFFHRSKYKRIYPGTFVIVLLHWGYEYQKMPETSQRAEAIRLIESGADAIIGHHPHVIQTIEYFNHKPVIYSLGNFVFDPKREEATKGLLVRLSISNDKVSLVGEEINIKDCIPSIVKEYVIKE